MPCYELLGGKVRDRIRVYWSHHQGAGRGSRQCDPLILAAVAVLPPARDACLGSITDEPFGARRCPKFGRKQTQRSRAAAWKEFGDRRKPPLIEVGRGVFVLR